MRAATNETARIAVALCFVYVLQSLIARMTISESALGLIRNNGPRGWVKESLSRGECFNPSASLCCSAVVSALVSPWHAENMLPGVAGQLMSFIMASTPRGIERWIERMINRSEAQCILIEYCSCVLPKLMFRTFAVLIHPSKQTHKQHKTCLPKVNS